MKIFIERYRTFEIHFDTEEETFTSISDYYDNEQKKKSFSAAKTAIDKYIKENNVFKPFLIVGIPGEFSFKREKEIKIVGIRKDGAFVCQKGDETMQFSKYEERHYMIYNRENDEIMEKISQTTARYEQARKTHKTEIELLIPQLKIKKLDDWRKENQNT